MIHANPNEIVNRMVMRKKRRKDRQRSRALVGAGRVKTALENALVEPVRLIERPVEHEHGERDHGGREQPHPRVRDDVAGGVEGNPEHHDEREDEREAEVPAPNLVGHRTGGERCAVDTRDMPEQTLDHRASSAGTRGHCNTQS